MPSLVRRGFTSCRPLKGGALPLVIQDFVFAQEPQQPQIGEEETDEEEAESVADSGDCHPGEQGDQADRL